METPATPYHQQQILNGIPDWTRQLHPTHINRLMRHAHNEHIQENGQPSAWFSTASAKHQLQLREAIRRRTTNRQRLAQALSELQTLPQFCEPLLKTALPSSVPVTVAQYCYQPFELVPTGDLENVPGLEELGLPGGAYQPQWTAEPVGTPIPRSLLEAAMHNFEGMTEVGPFSTLQVSPRDPASVLGLSVTSFVTRCRKLDLGKRYQTHLDSVFKGTREEQVRAAWVSAHRAELTVQAVIAVIRNRVTQLGYEALRYFCTEGATPRYGRHPITVRSLRVLGMQVNDAMLLGPATTTDQDVIAYLPFDDDCPLQEFTSLEEMTSYLIDRLRNTDYRQRFLEHIRQGDRPKMSLELDKALLNTAVVVSPPPGRLPTGIRPVNPPDLSIRERQITAPYWDNLYDAHVLALKDNARAIAVPTAEADAKARQARLASWEELGLNVLNVAALFVPGLDVVMLGVFAVQLMGNIFHAFEAWQEGDYAEAVAQVESLALTAASVVVIGTAAKLVKASGFVDWLERITIEGKEQLWHPQLTAYRTQVAIPAELKPNDQGLYKLGDQDFIRLDGETFEVQKNTNGHWELLHPQDPTAYRPALHGNGKGAWRLAHERVTDWPTPKLLRRLGPSTDLLSDADLLAVLDSTGLGRGALESVLADGEPLPTRLEDALLRLSKDIEADDIIARTRDGRPLAAYKSFAASALSSLPGWPEDVLIKVFDGPEPWGNATRYGRDRWGDREIPLTRNDLDRGDLARIVLDHLDEASIARLLPEGTQAAQRQQALQDLLADHLLAQRQHLFDSLYLGQRSPLSPAAQVVGKQFPTLPQNTLEQIVGAARSTERARLLAERVPLRVAEQARGLQARVRMDRALLGLHRPTLENADGRLIRKSLLTQHPEWTAEQVLKAALADRPGMSRLIGQQAIRPNFRPPMRLSDGRLGYPLSPWASDSKLKSELKGLFPALDDRQMAELLATLRKRGDVPSQIKAMTQEISTLRSELAQWVEQTPDIGQRNAQQIASELIRCWHRLGADTLELANLDAAVIELPSVSARFDHITTFSLDNVDIINIPADFLQSFPTLERLHIRSSQNLHASSLFEALQHAPKLRELHVEGCLLLELSDPAHQVLPTLTELETLSLRRNALTLSVADLQALGRLPKLSKLDLYRNDITLDATKASLFADIRRLRELNLGGNPLRVSPDLSSMSNLQTLNLEHCELDAWPTGLNNLMENEIGVLRQVNLGNNRIATVPDPDALLRTHFMHNLRFHLDGRQLLLNYNPLNTQLRGRLTRAGVAAETDLEETAAQQVNWRESASAQQQESWDNLFGDDEHADLRLAIEQVGMSRAAQEDTLALSEQIWQLLARAAEDTQLRERLNEVAGAFPVTCGDAGADAFGTLQIEVMAYDQADGQPNATPKLFDFFRSLYRRDQVNELAMDICNARVNRRTGLLERRGWEALPADERGKAPTLPALYDSDTITDALLLDERGLGLDLIEIRLALRTELAKELDFPELQPKMLYRDIAKIDGPLSIRVEETVRERDADLQARRHAVSRHSSWRRLLRAEYQARFDGLRERWDVGLEYLDSCLGNSDPQGTLEQPVVEALTSALGQNPLDAQGQPRRLEINEGQYVTGMQRMALGLENNEDDLYLELTIPLDKGN
ncbi:dermonecrotic toxin domain-containing protein [Pseudomonas sichuanensis]|uniref:dermonecrotic toxin domain-containing protein n=1 Tax=Pseudomonas sichuanensis TaxID=2213015 RepID=UPI00382F7DF2